jgi:NADP-dependent 3-hydroxy acid dehydrogenase YdfG
MTRFTDQIAVVTGASSGVGRAIASALAAKGAVLCLVGRHEKTLEAAAESMRATASDVLCCRADLTLDRDIQGLTAQLQRLFGHVDVLIHSAGVIALGPLEAVPVGDLDWQYGINVRAPYVLTQALLPLLRPRQGQIVFLNSSVGLHARANVGQYAATKHALKAIADSLRDEVNAEGLRVLSVFLGRTATPMQQTVHAMEGRGYHPELLIQPEDVAAVVMNALDLPRSAEVTEISIRPLKKPNSPLHPANPST